MSDPKVLFFDIETAPILGYVWRPFQADLLKIVEDWYMICWASKWRGNKKVDIKALPDFKGYERNKRNDKKLITALWEKLDEADIVVGHNLDRFDVKKSNAKFFEYGLGPPRPYQTVDTLTVARKHFKLTSNKLNEVARVLGIPGKAETGGLELWFRCMAGDRKAWAKMKRYNGRDVTLLEEVYDAMLPWMTNHPNLNVYNGQEGCPNCGGRVKKDGTRTTRAGKYQQYKCVECASWHKGEFIKGTRAVIK